MSALQNIAAASLALALALPSPTAFADETADQKAGAETASAAERTAVTSGADAETTAQTATKSVGKAVESVGTTTESTGQTATTVSKTAPDDSAPEQDKGPSDATTPIIVQVGEVIDVNRIHLVTQPGRYGLGNPPAGSRYAIAENRLIRVDAKSGQILSIIRMVDAIVD